MAEIAPIRRSEEITRDWLTAVLTRAGLLAEGSALAGFSVKSLFGEARGFLSRVVRVELDYGADGGSAPKSLIVKLPPAEDERFALGASIHAYEREMRFYSEIAGTTAVSVPRCYFAAKEAASDGALIVIEDARDWRPADQVQGLGRDLVETTIDMVANLHARWWQAPAIDAMTWLPDAPWDHRDLFREAWPGFLAAHRHWLSAESLALGERLAAAGPAMVAALARPPRTLAHCDVRADNLMIEGPDPTRPVLLLDWQTLSRTMGAIDPARLSCGSLERPLSAAGYRDIAMHWHRRISDLGVEGYGEEEAWRDFRVGLLHALYIPICFHSNLSHEGDRAIRLLEALVHRMFRAAEECDALSCLEGL